MICGSDSQATPPIAVPHCFDVPAGYGGCWGLAGEPAVPLDFEGLVDLHRLVQTSMMARNASARGQRTKTSAASSD